MADSRTSIAGLVNFCNESLRSFSGASLSISGFWGEICAALAALNTGLPAIWQECWGMTIKSIQQVNLLSEFIRR